MRNGLIALCIMIILANIGYIAYRKQQPEPATQAKTARTAKNVTPFTLGNHGQTNVLNASTAQLHRNNLNPTQGDAHIKGVVLTSAGTPAAGAEVLLTHPPTREKLLQPSAKANRWHTITKDDGSFQFESLPEGQVLVFAQHQSSHALTRVKLNIHSTAGDVALHLAPSHHVQGRVIDSTGAPVPYARIYPVKTADPTQTDSPYAFFPAHSDKEGSFTFPYLTSEDWSFLAIANNLAPALAQPDEDTGKMLISLNIGKSFEGSLFNEKTGRYINNVHVELIEKEYSLERARYISNKGGTYHFDKLRPGHYNLYINSDTYTLGSGTKTIEIVAGETMPELELIVVSAGQIRGRILDKKGRGGVGDITVVATAIGEGQSTIRSATSDVAGYYRITGLSAGKYQVEAQAREPYVLQAPTRVEILAQAGKQIKGPDFRVGTGTTIQGKVLDKHGSPVSNASIRLSLTADHNAQRDTRSDGDGLFQLKNIGPKTEVRIWAEHGTQSSVGYGPVRVPAQGLTGLTITLDRSTGASIHGRVSNAQGRILAGATVLCYVPDASLPEPLTTQTDAEGRYYFIGLHAGAYRLQAGATADSIHENTQVQIDLEKDSPFEDADIILP